MRSCIPALLILIVTCTSFARQSCRDLLTDTIEDQHKTDLMVAKHLEELKHIGSPNLMFPQDPGVRYEVSQTAYPRSAWHIEQIQSSSNHSFYLFDVGLKHLEEDQINFNEIYRKHLAAPDTYKRPIHFDRVGEAKQALEELKKWRWAFHDAVMSTYAHHPHKKQYIDPLAISGLISENSSRENSDVFGIITHPQQSLQSLGRDQIRKLTAVTVQLTYPATELEFLSQPDFSSFYFDIRKQPSPQKYLPFMNGIRKPLSKIELGPSKRQTEPFPYRDMTEFFKKFYSDFPDQNIAEINRLAKPSKDAPDALLDLILLRLFDRAEEMKISTLFASTDRATRLLFTRRYGFSDYLSYRQEIFNLRIQEIIGEADETEYVIFIRVGSPEYSRMKLRLIESVKQLEVHPSTFSSLDVPK